MTYLIMRTDIATILMLMFVAMLIGVGISMAFGHKLIAFVKKVYAKLVKK